MIDPREPEGEKARQMQLLLMLGIGMFAGAMMVCMMMALKPSYC